QPASPQSVERDDRVGRENGRRGAYAEEREDGNMERRPDEDRPPELNQQCREYSRQGVSERVAERVLDDREGNIAARIEYERHYCDLGADNREAEPSQLRPR